jgi:DNA-binding phage protein
MSLAEIAPAIHEYNLADQKAAMDALYQERIALGMSLGDMEEKSGVSVNSFYYWKSAKRSPQLANLVALAQTLGFEVMMTETRPPFRSYCLQNMTSAVQAIDAARREERLSTTALRNKTSVATNSFYSWLKLQRDPTLIRFLSLVEPLGFRVVIRRNKVK